MIPKNEVNKNPAEESIPKEIKDFYGRHNQQHKINPGTGFWERDNKGNYVYEVDKKAAKHGIKLLAQGFARRGADIEQIDFDLYKIDPGITLDKIPRGTLAVIEYGDHIFVIDKRKNTNYRPEGDHWFNHNIKRTRDGKYVNASRIADTQFLNGARNIWIIPEDILTRDTVKVRDERAKYNAPDEYTRYKKYPRYYGPNSESYLDKSGYLIDKDEIRKKYNKIKAKLEISRSGNLSEYYKSIVDPVIETFNNRVEEILDKAYQIYKKQQDFSLLAKVTNELSNFKKDFQRLLDNASYYLEYASTSDYNRERLVDYLKKIKNFFDSDDTLSRLSREVMESGSATEGLSGKNNSPLRAVEHYFDSNFNAAFEAADKKDFGKGDK